LLAQYGTRCGKATLPPIDAMLMILAALCSFIVGRAASVM
jgi:hypothetical protein